MMGAYNFYERNKKTIDRLHTWSLETLIGCRLEVIRAMQEFNPPGDPEEYKEFLTCAKKEFEKHIKLKTQQQRSTEEVKYEESVI